MQPRHQGLAHKVGKVGVGRQFCAARIGTGIGHQDHSRSGQQAIGMQVVYDLRRGHVAQVRLGIKQHQQGALRRWGTRPIGGAVYPYVSAIAQGGRCEPVPLQTATGHLAALGQPRLRRRIGQLQYRAALVHVHRLRAFCGSCPVARVQRIALQGGQDAAALLHGRAIDIRHVWGKGIAQAHIARHHKTGPPHIVGQLAAL